MFRIRVEMDNGDVLHLSLSESRRLYEEIGRVIKAIDRDPDYDSLEGFRKDEDTFCKESPKPGTGFSWRMTF